MATTLIKSDVFVNHFMGDALVDPEVHELAQRIRVIRDTDNHDENAMTPVRLRIRLKSGQMYEQSVERALGHPDNPLSREQHLAKFRRCWEAGASHLPPASCQALIDLVDRLEDVPTVEEIVGLLTP